MRHGSLFNGIGGFQLAAQWMGWENVMSCEIDSFCNRVTKYYWPNCIQHEDIRTTDFNVWRGKIDILTGGFPCQPYSSAGKRLGKEDDRHLWPEMLRAIREIQPRYVVGENVRGLTNWNRGLVFDEVQVDLENEGYEVTPFLLPACAVNAPHRRDRIWFVAHSNIGTTRTPRKSGGIESNWSTNHDEQEQWGEQAKLNTRSFEFLRNDANTASEGLEGMRGEKGRFTKLRGRRNENEQWYNFPTQSPICDGNDGLSSRLDGITFPKWRTESIKAGGNAIVPQVAFEIFKAIELTMKR